MLAPRYVVPLALAAASALGLVMVACGEDTTPSSDAGFVDDTRDASKTTTSGGTSGVSSTSSSGGSKTDSPVDCTIAKVKDPDYGASGGPRGCTKPSDCVVRFTGDYCCPSEPQAMTSSMGFVFDESLNGYPTECREPCATVKCAAKPEATVVCTNNSCALQ